MSDPLAFFDYIRPGHAGCNLCDWYGRDVDDTRLVEAFIVHYEYRHQEGTS